MRPDRTDGEARRDKTRRGTLVVALVVIFLVALGVRLGYVLTLPEEVSFADSVKYRLVARNFRAGRGFVESERRRASRAPGYPLFLALIPGGAEGSLRAVRIVQSVLGAGLCLLLWLLARRLFGNLAGVIAAAIAAIYPFHIYLAGAILSELPFMVLLTLSMLLLHAAEKGSGAGGLGSGTTAAPAAVNSRPLAGGLAALAAGIALGLATLVRASLFLFPFFLLPFWLIWARGARRAALGRWLLVVAGFALALSPWVWRNYRLFGHFVPTTLQAGESLYEANNPDADGGPMIDRIDWEALAPRVDGKPLDEYHWDRFFHDEALRTMRAHPGRTLELGAIKLARFWNIVPNDATFRSPRNVAVSLASYVPVLLLAILGAFHGRRQWRQWLILVVPVLYYSGLHMVFVGSIRYRMPIMIYVMAFAGLELALLWRRHGNPKSR